MHWNYLVYVICFLLAMFSVIIEYRRANKQRLFLRIGTSFLAIVALAAIALPVGYWADSSYAGNEAVLLTVGFNKDSLDKLKNERLYTADAEIGREYPKAKLVSFEELSKTNPAIAKLHILGYGLNKDELHELNNIPIAFHGDKYPSGIISASWTEKVKQGQRFTLQGTFNHTGESQVRLVLKELNTTVDSVTIERPGKTTFELGSLTKSTGRLIDHLLVIKDDDTVANERIPFIIDPVKPLKILLLTAAPDFENKFLKDWLSSRGFEIAMRSDISKNKISTQFVNTGKLALEHLSAPLLDKFNVVITDLSVLKSLNKTEGAALEQQVNENGLGLIIRADTVLKSGAPFQNSFSIYPGNIKDQRQIAIQLQGEKFSSKISEAGQLFINNQDDVQPLVSDVQSRLLAGVALSGTGKILCTTLNSTYNWMLAGNKAGYENFWSLLVSKSAKAIPRSENWGVVTPLPTVNTPVTLQLETGQGPGGILVDKVHLSPIQNAAMPFHWQSTWWPNSTGWHSIQQTGGQPAWVYVYDKADWATVKAASKIWATKKYEAATRLLNVTKQIHSKTRITVPKIYFYLLLLICAAFLWAEPKMKQN
jgi:hypothetical protein